MIAGFGVKKGIGHANLSDRDLAVVAPVFRGRPLAGARHLGPAGTMAKQSQVRDDPWCHIVEEYLDIDRDT